MVQPTSSYLAFHVELIANIIQALLLTQPSFLADASRIPLNHTIGRCLFFHNDMYSLLDSASLAEYEAGVEANVLLETTPDLGTRVPNCHVCRDLVPASPNSSTSNYMDLKTLSLSLGLIPPPGYVELRNVSLAGQIMHDWFWVKPWTPPWPQATDWIKSATNGCRSCQIVVEGTTRFIPPWFSNMSSTADTLETTLTPAKIIVAFSKDIDSPLVVWLVDINEVWGHKRMISLEIFTHPGKASYISVVDL